MGREPDFADDLMDRITLEPVWKMCPTHRKLLFSNLTTRQMGRLEGVTSPAIVARRNKEFEKARGYLKRVGICNAYMTEVV